jgi:hypothetical protein
MVQANGAITCCMSQKAGRQIVPIKDENENGNIIGNNRVSSIQRQLWSKEDIQNICGGRQIITSREEIQTSIETFYNFAFETID